MSQIFTALVTGGSAGIGEDVCRRMLAKGWQVVSLARRPPAIEHENLIGVEADLLDQAATAEAAAEIARRFEITHVVHNAGLVWPNLLGEVTPEEVAGLTQIHVTAPLVLTQAVLPGMRQRGFGRIVFVTSRAAMGVPTRTAYSATKAAVHGMARTWALELGQDGITVNVVAPGPVRTDNFWGIIPKDSDRETELAAALPVRRLGSVEDISRAVLFFAEPEAGFVTGQVLFVCGGASLGGISL
ncbi:SDR family NAD(P)-dependent oxidoreductase [Algihabitans albus]|uniref:SDR family NAD(P)-dependent oxidoreductase n=1 Tax=Algihabitans albus TaxID=2164067 RepID=UPI000E5D1EC7|nr:SDR family oxidoreductase [Algihabitans albus]